jgi:hypothetical protein
LSLADALEIEGAAALILAERYNDLNKAIAEKNSKKSSETAMANQLALRDAGRAVHSAAAKDDKGLAVSFHYDN